MNNYGLNYLDFHQAIDIAYPTGTNVRNCFTCTGGVTVADTINGCGKTVQLEDVGHTGLFATYMHLNSFNVIVGDGVLSLQNFATVGSTGTSSAHLHFSLSEYPILYVNNNNSTEIKKFMDPFMYLS